ncbi:MAG: RNase adapter RapZ [Proteobacteria bacterium]|nr:RNase adapter RapZ [Pseudomonadota bacterium]MDA1058749.1 RNase adapter RapZ [Pseudomonadota bacterium]
MPEQDPKSDAASGSPVLRVLLVTGISGAGRSTTLKMLEDLGYEAMDNIPLNLLLGFLTSGSSTLLTPHGAIAAGIDIRTRDFDVEHFLERIAPLSSRPDIDLSLLFLDCDDEFLSRRYTETRRRHPLAEDQPVLDGIRMEREIIGGLRDHADLVIDTSAMTGAGLRHLLAGHYSLEEGPALTATLTSFSFRKGLPREADLVFDVRFLRNPHYLPALTAKSGMDREVADYIDEDPALGGFLTSVGDLLLDLMPRYASEGKTYLTIAIGCTGGQHRSVYVAERLATTLEAAGHAVNRRHRDVTLSGATS